MHSITRIFAIATPGAVIATVLAWVLGYPAVAVIIGLTAFISLMLFLVFSENKRALKIVSNIAMIGCFASIIAFALGYNALALILLFLPIFIFFGIKGEK